MEQKLFPGLVMSYLTYFFPFLRMDERQLGSIAMNILIYVGQMAFRSFFGAEERVSEEANEIAEYRYSATSRDVEIQNQRKNCCNMGKSPFSVNPNVRISCAKNSGV